jgi:peptidoglycan/LPS O-acetylase OafA/YrhL
MAVDQIRMHARAQTTVTPAAAHAPVVRIHELDGLRGILALLVVSYHMYGPLALVHAMFADHMPLFTQAWYAVDVFFLMSGFVMMHVYGKNFEHGPLLRNFVQFLRARIARLYPVHLLALVVMAVVMIPLLLHTGVLFAWQGRYSFGAFASSLLMLHGPWLEYRSWNYPAWSISAEWHAYLLFPVLWMCARRMAGLRALLLLALCCLIPFWLYHLDLQPDQYPTNGLALLGRALPLFFGGMLMQRIDRSRWHWSGWSAGAMVIATVALLWHDASAPFAVLLAPALVFSALSANWFQRVLRTRPLLFLGKISYSLYMTHALIEAFFVEVTVRLASRLFHLDFDSSLPASLSIWFIGVCVALVLGYLTWRWVEEPARGWLMRRTAMAVRH